MAVDDFAFDEMTLEVCGDQIDAAYLAPVARGVSEERTRRGILEGRREDLVVIDTGFEGSALDAQASFRGAVAFGLVHPNQLVHTPSGRQLVSRDSDPRLVLRMVSELFLLGFDPDFSASYSLGVCGRGVRRVGSQGVAYGSQEIVGRIFGS